MIVTPLAGVSDGKHLAPGSVVAIFAASLDGVCPASAGHAPYTEPAARSVKHARQIGGNRCAVVRAGLRRPHGGPLERRFLADTPLDVALD